MRNLLLIVFLFIFILNEEIDILNAKKNKFYKIIGIFSSCFHHQESLSKQTQHELISTAIQKLCTTLFTRECLAPNTCSNERNFTEFYHYEEYDVCHDVDHLLDILIKLRIGDGDYYLELSDNDTNTKDCLLYTSPSPRDQRGSRMPSSA